MSASARREGASSDSDTEAVPKKTLRLVQEVAKRHFDHRARKVLRRGGGLTNTVLEFSVPQGAYVFRMHEDAAKIHDYFKEQWAMEAARAVRVPTPCVLEVASLADGRPYMILERLAGIEGRQGRDRLALVREMGGAARRRPSPEAPHLDPDTSRTRALIDWDTCTSSPAPYWDLSISLHDLGIDEKEAFLESYGLTPRQFAAAVRFVRMLRDLNYAHAVRSAAETRKRQRLEWCRLRLAAGLALFEP